MPARLRLVAVASGMAILLAACGSTAPRTAPTSTASAAPAPSSSSATTATPSSDAPASSASGAAPAPTAAHHGVPSSSAPQTALVPSGTGPIIVIDPGHAPTINHIDPATGLNDSDYENEPEMRDVFAVALLVQAKLAAAGYRVIMTKATVTTRISLGERAAVANNAHAALALSIHDQAGANGGIGFTQGNNIVYYQSVGDYRETPAGKKVYFTDAAVAALSKKYAAYFQAARESAQGTSVTVQGNTGYDLGSRGLAPGNIWIVQLLADVPWIYNEAGGNSAGMSGLDAADEQRYADGLVAAVERSVPIH